MPIKSVKYPGKLGKPIAVRDSEAAVMDAMLGVQDGGLTACIAAIDELRRERDEVLLLALLDHYDIARDDKQRWFQLAHKLARAHVPAFRSALRVGRPRKFKNGMSLAEFLGAPQPRRKGKAGRKREWTDEKYRKLAIHVRDWCVRLDLKGRGAAKKALTEWLKSHARKHNESERETIRDNLKNLQKRHSEAKKKFPELA